MAMAMSEAAVNAGLIHSQREIEKKEKENEEKRHRRY